MTTRRVADEAGLPLGTVHYWYAGKEALVAAVVDALLTDLRTVADEEVDGASAGRLERIHDRYASMPIGRQIALFEITTFAVRDDDLRGLAREQYAAYTATARSGIQDWADSADVDLPGGADALAALVVAVMDGLSLAELAAPDDPSRKDALRLFSYLLENRST